MNRFLLAPLVFASLVSCEPPQERSATTPLVVRTPSPENVALYFISPLDGDTVSTPVLVRFGLSGMGVAPAGIDVDGTGHHHLLVDVDSLPALDRPVPSDDNHRHFGGGQTETSLDLLPGAHTLQLLLGDMTHMPHDPPILSDVIQIHVE